MNDGRYVFRAWPRQQPRPLLASSLPEISSDTKFHTRKAHRKSRAGCIACKKRRKKCDEGRPSCSRCQNKKIDCKYVEKQQSERPPHDARANPCPLSKQLWPVARSPPVLTTLDHSQRTSQDLFLLNHFIQNSDGLVLGPDYSKVFTTKALEIALEVPFLMHAMLALSACQLLHTVPERRPYKLPEALHAQLASQGLRRAIGHMNSARDMDAVFTSAMLLNCLAFCYADWREDEATFERSKPSWQWLRISLGIKDLIIETKPFHKDSIWMPMFVATNTFTIVEPIENDLNARLAEYCNITSDSNDVENAYYAFYEKLGPLVVRAPQVRLIRMYSNAIGALDNHFLELLEQEDSKAMMLFVHWLGLMSSFVHWTTRRTRRECWLMCRILDQKLVGKDRLLLETPALACGYPLDVAKPFWPSYYISRSELHEQAGNPLLISKK